MIKEKLTPYLYLMPFLSIFVIFLGYPIFYSFYLSFHKATIYTDWFNVIGDMKYVGAQNYVKLLFNDYEFWWSLVASLIYATLTIPTSILFSLALAVLLMKKIRGRVFFRSAYFLPNILDLLVVGLIWVFIYSPIYGLLDIILNYFGIGAISREGFLGNPWTVLPAIAVAVVLKGAGFGMILFMAALANISPSIFEASEIDGANSYQKFRYITIPMVKPIILFLVITGVMASLNAFTEIYAMTSSSGGAPIDIMGNTVKSANIVGFYLYKNFESGNYGYTAAISFVLLFIAGAISFINYKILYRKK